MLPESGHLALIVAFVLALAQGVLPLAGAATGNARLIAVARPAALLQCAFLLLAFAALVAAFVGNDFTLAYVANNSNSLLPWYFRVSAVWAEHEGSMLLWALMLAGWSAAVAAGGRALPEVVMARVLGVMGLVAAGFHAFILFASNPFERLLPFFPVDGADLNPLLQDVGLILHPPLLYMGYVGFSVAFAFAIAGLLEGRLDSAWARWSRPWTLVAWIFLTLGIATGSWWAYYELGWGGWWFWDPVENASLMPWLAGTALLHSLAVTEKRGMFRAWTVLLAILAFALSLLGTFLVRSGVLTSVHAFASDPARGTFILALLVLLIGSALALFAWRASSLRREGSCEAVSREGMLLANNLMLMAALAVVLLGTLYPLVADALGLGRISVGPPYFDLLFAPLAILTMALLAVGVNARWKAHPPRALWREHGVWAAAGAVAGGASGAILLTAGHPAALAALAGAGAVIAAHGVDLWRKVRGRRARPSRSYLGMWLAHVGVAASAIGIAVLSANGMSRDVRLAPGDAVTLGDYTYRLQQMESVAGPNHVGLRARVEVSRGDQRIAERFPEKRTYPVRGNVMTEAGIVAGPLLDHYVSIGEALDGGAWSFRVQQKPLLRWVWGGGLLMALGALWAMLDRRYRPGARRPVADRERLNVAIYRARLEELDAERDAQRLDDARHAMLVAELKRRLVADIDGASTAPAGGERAQPPAAVWAAVALLALALYPCIGFDRPVRDWLALSLRAPDAAALLQSRAHAGNLPPDLALADAARLAQASLGRAPGDAQAWYRLGLVWVELDAPELALGSLRTAARLAPRDLDILVARADIELALAGGALSAEARDAFERALAVEPRHRGILMSYGMAAFGSGDYATAVTCWERLRQVLEPGSATARLLERSIDAATRRAAQQAGAPR